LGLVGAESQPVRSETGFQEQGIVAGDAQRLADP
jgi:hypothetical protein